MKTLVISDQPLTVLAMQAMLRRMVPEAELFDATHLAEAMELLSESGPFDLMLLDLDAHGVRRVSGAALLRQMWPSVPLALISEAEHDEDMVRGADIGALGYLLKNDPTDKLSDVLAHVLAGQVNLPEHCASAS